MSWTVQFNLRSRLTNINKTKILLFIIERIEVQLEQYNENDEPEFQKFIARRFGAEQTRLRELAEQTSLAPFRHEKLRYMAREEGMSQRNYCVYLESQVTPETDFWAVLENEVREM